MATILVIDDEKGIRDVLKTSLELAGHDVLVAANGKDALTRGEQGPIHVVITDIFMPEQDGFETIMHLKKTAPQIKIIAISGGGYFNPENALKTAEHLGAHYGFNKPFNLQDLIEKIDSMLKERPA
ncbi:response regulator [candidate division KSB1 bacterium]|nr:response regulator [candidate division KSB1 bacterium]RQW01070.1 MAG: response regulator [candidate division KSB1 bacterium]